MEHNKKDWEEVEQVEKCNSWKLSVRSAALEREIQRKKDMKQYIACKEKGPWRKRNPPSDDESPGGRARPAQGAASTASMVWSTET